MTEVALIFVALTALVPCLLHAPTGFALTLVAGLVQDPIRKTLPEEPIYITVLSGLFLGTTLVGLLLRGRRLGFGTLMSWNRVLVEPLVLFLVLVVVQSGVTFAKTGNPALAGLGMLAYGAPLPAFILGFHLGGSERRVRRYLVLYIAGATAMVSGVYLSVLGVDWDLLRSVGVGLHAYSPFGGILDLHPGFFRGSELAGWHGAAAASLAVILFVTRRRATAPILVSLLMLFLLGAVLFTGRRKFLVETAVFLLLFGVGLWYWRAGGGRFRVLLLTTGVLAALGIVWFVTPSVLEMVSPYYVRGLYVSDEAPDRVVGLTFVAFRWIILRNGFWGAGAGMGSQGAQYFGGGWQAVGSAAEGGPGKVLAELGVPGLILLLWLGVAFARYAHSVVKDARRREPARLRLALGLGAFVAANAVVFVIAHQIFGDVFVLIVLGWIAGTLCAVPHMRLGSKAAEPRRVAASRSGRPRAPAPARR